MMILSRSKIATFVLVALLIVSSLSVFYALVLPDAIWFGQHASTTASTNHTTKPQVGNLLNISSNIEIHFNDSVEMYDWSPDNSKILYGPFSYAPGYEADVWTMSPDGSNRTPLLTLSSPDMYISGVRYSPDGKRLLFVGVVRGEMEGQSYYNLYLVNIDGTNRRELRRNDVSWHPSWSPDGQKIVFVKIQTGDSGRLWSESDIWIVNVDGTELRQVTDLPGSELYPSWSPDGKRIAFIHSETTGGPTNSTVHVVNADGSGETMVLNSTFKFYGELSWSPDSSILIASGEDDMYAFTIDGRIVRRIIASGWNPRLSHDGRRILYEGPQPQTMAHVTLNVNVATFNKPLSLETLAEYSSVPATVHPPLPPEKDLLVGYKIELDNVEYTFNISYRNTNMRGYSAEPGDRFLWTTYKSLNKGTTAVISPIGTTYGIKIQFDNGSEIDVTGGYGLLEPRDPNLGGGSNIEISANLRAVAFIIFVKSTGETLVSVPLPG